MLDELRAMAIFARTVGLGLATPLVPMVARDLAHGTAVEVLPSNIVYPAPFLPSASNALPRPFGSVCSTSQCCAIRPWSTRNRSHDAAGSFVDPLRPGSFHVIPERANAKSPSVTARWMTFHFTVLNGAWRSVAVSPRRRPADRAGRSRARRAGGESLGRRAPRRGR
jgi:hypothetical protein